ncbi:MAG: hypothetical protein ACI9N9_000024 [Enterobacterales bacterium]|jgi:hypothetical protein
MKKEDLVVGDQYEVIEDSEYFEKGEIVTLIKNRGNMPLVKSSKHENKPILIQRIKPYKRNEMKTTKKKQRELVTEAVKWGKSHPLIDNDKALKTFLKSKGLQDDKLEVGKPYYYKLCKALFVVTKSDEDFYYGYGIDRNGCWFDEMSVVQVDQLHGVIPANQEWEAALIGEAEKLGFAEGVKYVCAHDSSSSVTLKNFDEIMFFRQSNILSDGHGGAILYNGKWATIIEEPTEAEKIDILWKERNN